MSALHELLKFDLDREPIRPTGKVIPLRVAPQARVHVNPRDYDRIALAYSGGKDSVASLLHLLDLGVDPGRIELHHHLVDGRESTLMDWPVTEDADFTIVGVTSDYLHETLPKREQILGKGVFVAFPDNPHTSEANST